MKKEIYSILLLTLFPSFLFAQLFTKVTTGPVVSSAGDSRSVNFVDVNNDGWDDLFISNGPQSGDNNFLFMNNGDGTFTSVAGDDIVTTNGAYDGGAFGDYDNDGDLDALVVTWWNEKDHFFRNNGDGTFTEETSVAPAIPSNYSEAVTWGDYDNDGWLDLYISTSEGDFKNLLYHNNGDGSFTKVLSGAQSTDAFTSRGVTFIDYDLDNDADIYVTNESNEANNLYQNDGDGTFTKITTGPVVSDSRSTMSASWGDIDNDGDPDLYTANSGNSTGQKNQLYINNGDGTFTEITTGDAVNDLGCSFSSSFEDYDNDGDLDLAVSNGFCNGTILNFLYLNDGSGNFTRDLSSIADLSTPCSYGCAFGDVNNDGFPDLVFATCNNTGIGADPSDIFYMNNGNGNHWLKLNLKGTESNHSAIGAKVKVKATINGNPVWQYREVTTQSGYCSQNSMTVHFGLGDATVVDSVTVIFPAGNDTTLTNIPVDQTLTIVEASTTGIEDFKPTASINCHPTLVSDHFVVYLKNLTAGEDVILKMISVGGRIAQEKKVTVNSPSQSIRWEVNSLSEGIYFIEVAGKYWTSQCPVVVARNK